MRDPNQVSLYFSQPDPFAFAISQPGKQQTTLSVLRTMTITDASNAPAPAEDVSIERFVDPSVAGAGAADRRKSSVSTFVWMGSRKLINFIVWANFHLPKQLTVLPLFVTWAPRHQSKTMEDQAVAVAAEEVPSDEAKAAETKEDAPAPPAAGDATAEASDKKEVDEAEAGTEEPPKDDAKMADKGEKTTSKAEKEDATPTPGPSLTTPHVAPPEIWGRVLDFMPYEEVRSTLLVGKIIANKAVKCVRTLNFMKGCQLDGPSTRRFQNVEEVNCLCLMSGQWRSAVLCGDTAIRLVPLLTTFPKMKEVRIAGLVTEDAGNGQTQLVRRSYDPRHCSSPANHRDLVTVLCQSLLGAFKARLLSQALNSKGDIAEMLVWSDICQDRNGDEVLCKTCADVCACFPLKEILGPGFFNPCNDDFVEVFEQVIAKREGARDVLRKHSAEFHSIISIQSPRAFLLENAESEEEEALRRRLADLGVQIEPPHVRYLDTDAFDDLDRLIAIGCDPSALSKEVLDEVLTDPWSDCRVFAKSTFDALVARGFALHEADLIVLDERMEPALMSAVPSYL